MLTTTAFVARARRFLAVAALLAAGLVFGAPGTAQAAPFAPAPALAQTAGSPLIEVRHGRHHHGWGHRHHHRHWHHRHHHRHWGHRHHHHRHWGHRHHRHYRY
ncbi:MAG: hypothetical protein K2X71_26510 [Methylobacterium sp.]|uniref:hypothetical protein n=1 Tax=Methylobacterium sp. TaxID=409 RepID=UPI002587E4E0|nr:hypothetical protein [Methylobacterium sp.]MBY0299543.1 hypothetical protein [Methylobacterium sp.]